MSSCLSFWVPTFLCKCKAYAPSLKTRSLKAREPLPYPLDPEPLNPAPETVNPKAQSLTAFAAMGGVASLLSHASGSEVPTERSSEFRVQDVLGFRARA